MIPMNIKLDPTDIEKRIDELYHRAWYGGKFERINSFKELLEIKAETKNEQINKQVSIDLITLNYYHDIKFLLEGTVK